MWSKVLVDMLTPAAIETPEPVLVSDAALAEVAYDKTKK